MSSVRLLMARQRPRRQPRSALLLALLVVTLALLLVLGARPAGAPVWRQQQRGVNEEGKPTYSPEWLPHRGTRAERVRVPR